MTKNASIMNLCVTGTVKSEWQAAGIVAYGVNNGEIKIINCINKANITGKNMVGGIAASYMKIIENCKNYGSVEITGSEYRICWYWRNNRSC